MRNMSESDFSAPEPRKQAMPSGSGGPSTQRGISRIRTITARGIAELLEVSVYTVHRRKKCGVLPQPIKGSSNPELWNRGEIHLYLESIGLRAI
jgi:predicted DNA-binding transcriptional regulator AlpA